MYSQFMMHGRENIKLKRMLYLNKDLTDAGSLRQFTTPEYSVSAAGFDFSTSTWRYVI